MNAKSDSDEHVWVFMGGGHSPSAVFTTRSSAEEWISRTLVSGTLTAYPLDTSPVCLSLSRGIEVSRNN